MDHLLLQVARQCAHGWVVEHQCARQLHARSLAQRVTQLHRPQRVKPCVHQRHLIAHCLHTQHRGHHSTHFTLQCRLLLRRCRVPGLLGLLAGLDTPGAHRVVRLLHIVVLLVRGVGGSRLGQQIARQCAHRWVVEHQRTRQLHTRSPGQPIAKLHRPQRVQPCVHQRLIHPHSSPQHTGHSLHHLRAHRVLLGGGQACRSRTWLARLRLPGRLGRLAAPGDAARRGHRHMGTVLIEEPCVGYQLHERGPHKRTGNTHLQRLHMCIRAAQVVHEGCHHGQPHLREHHANASSLRTHQCACIAQSHAAAHPSAPLYAAAHHSLCLLDGRGGVQGGVCSRVVGLPHAPQQRCDGREQHHCIHRRGANAHIHVVQTGKLGCKHCPAPSHRHVGHDGILKNATGMHKAMQRLGPRGETRRLLRAGRVASPGGHTRLAAPQTSQLLTVTR